MRTDQVATTITVEVPVRLKCSSSSSPNVSFMSNNGTYTSTVAKTTADNLGVSLLWADNIAADLNGTVKKYANLSGDLDISLKARLVDRGTLAPSAFTSRWS